MSIKPNILFYLYDAVKPHNGIFFSFLRSIYRTETFVLTRIKTANTILRTTESSICSTKKKGGFGKAKSPLNDRFKELFFYTFR